MIGWNRILLGQTQRNDPKILFLMFVNDCIIFAKATPKASSSINKV